MKLYKKLMPDGRKSPTWYFNIQIDGRRINRSTGCSTKKGAEKWLREYVESLRNKSSGEAVSEVIRTIKTKREPMAIADAFETWKSSPKRHQPKKRQVESVKSKWLDFAAFIKTAYPQTTYLHHVTPEMCAAFLQEKRYEGLSETTVAGRRTACKGVVRAAMKAAGLSENPWNDIPPPAITNESRDVFTDDELRAIRDNADDYLKPIVVLGIYTGLRLGSMTNLLWEDISADGKWLNAPNVKARRDVRIPILQPLQECLVSLPRTNEYILPEQRHAYINDPSSISRRFKTLLDELGIKHNESGMTLAQRRVAARDAKNEGERLPRDRSIKDIHSLRHSFAWVAGRYGVPLPIVRSVLDHMSDAMTARYQAHANDTAKAGALSILSGYLAPSPARSPKDELINLLENSDLSPEDLTTARALIQKLS